MTAPDKADPALKALEKRLSSACAEIDAVIAEAEERFPVEGCRWTAVFCAGKPESAYLSSRRVPQIDESEEEDA